MSNIFKTLESLSNSILFEIAIDLNKKDEKSYNQKGLVLIKLQQYEDALTAFDSSIEANNKFIEAYLNQYEESDGLDGTLRERYLDLISFTK